MNTTNFDSMGTLTDLGALALEQSASIKRTSSKYVATMVDIVSQLNSQPINKLAGVNLEEVRNQNGNLVYFRFKDISEPIPCDIEFVTRLYCHLRRPCLLMLKKDRQWLSAAHRRIYSKLEKEHLLEKHFNPDADMFQIKFNNILKEIDRHKKMVEMVKGGGRKLDILNHAQNVYSHAKFEIFFRERSLLDPNHPRHLIIQKWLKKSKHQGSIESFKADISNLEETLTKRAEWIFEKQKAITGIELPVDNEHPDLSKSWFTLGKPLPRGEEFIQHIIQRDDFEDRIKRTTFMSIRKGWEAQSWSHHLAKLKVDEQDVQDQAGKLSKLILDLAHLMDAATHQDGDAYQAVISDVEHGLLTEREAYDANRWIARNQVGLHNVMMDSYQSLMELHESNEHVLIPPEIEATIEKLKNQDKQIELAPPEESLNIEGRFEHWKSSPPPPEEFWRQSMKLHQNFHAKIAEVAMHNVSYHQELRRSCNNSAEYEVKALGLMEKTKIWREQQVEIEKILIEKYKEGPIEGVPDEILQNILGFILEKQVTQTRKLNFELLEADPLENRMNAAMAQSSTEALTRLDYIFQEVQATPKATAIIQALSDWKKAITKEETQEKQTWLEENELKLENLSSQLRNEMRELLHQVPNCSRRLRFQVFGISDQFAGNLDQSRMVVMKIVEKSTNLENFQCHFQRLKDLENQALEAQKSTKRGGDTHSRLIEMKDSGQIHEELLKQLEGDLKENYRDLDGIIQRIAKDMKTIADWRLRLGEENQFDYLEISVNADDLEELNQKYDFAESATHEQIRRFCLAYQFKSNLVAEVFSRARDRDPNLPPEVLQSLDKKVVQAFFNDRLITPLTRLTMASHLPEVFESECDLLMHTLNLVQPDFIRKKVAYKSIVQTLSVYKKQPPGLKRKSTVLFGRLQGKLMAYKADSLQANYDNNRSALFTDIEEATENEFTRPR